MCLNIVKQDLLTFFVVLQFEPKNSMTKNSSLKVAILIPTLNRSDFLIRQLDYYAKLKSPHPIYIGDSSSPEHIRAARAAIDRLKDMLDITYKEFPNYNGAESAFRLLELVKEKYATFNGDDDFHVPDSLTKCAEFLEENPDYATATSYVVNFKLKASGAHGEIAALKEYPRPENHCPIASERILQHFTHYMVTNISVNRTDNLRRNWSYFNQTKDKAINEELLPASLALIDGKAKTLNRLGVIRQMHDKQYALAFSYDWITTEDWLPSFKIFFRIMSERLAEKDGISLEEAKKAMRQACWIYLKKDLEREYPQAFPGPEKSSSALWKKFRKIMVRIFPFLRTFYRRLWLPKVRKRIQMHYEVSRKDSKYYKDFQPVLDSLKPRS